jgi:glycosyltransferase involved in cell wall biosynthesis
MGAQVRVLGFGTYELTKHPRSGIILDGLRAHGDDVVEINEPLGFSTAERVEMLAKPWLIYRLVARILARWAGLGRRSLRARRGEPFDAILVGYLGHFDVLLARMLFPRGRIVLDQLIFAADTARDRGVMGGPRLRLLAALDRLAVRCADVVIVDTQEHLGLLAEEDRPKGVVVAVGASEAWFRASAVAWRPGGVMRIVFFGLFTPLQGTPVIGEALAMLADRTDIAVTMIGTGQDYDLTRSLAAANTSVSWLDWVEAGELPRMIAAHDVCLGIFGTSPKAQRVVPNKVYQAAAAGCAIITSDTAAQRRMLGDAATYVPAGDAIALVKVLRALAEDDKRVRTLGMAARGIAAARFKASAIVEPLRVRLSS